MGDTNPSNATVARGSYFNKNQNKRSLHTDVHQYFTQKSTNNYNIYNLQFTITYPELQMY